MLSVINGPTYFNDGYGVEALKVLLGETGALLCPVSAAKKWDACAPLGIFSYKGFYKYTSGEQVDYGDYNNWVLPGTFMTLNRSFYEEVSRHIDEGRISSLPLPS